MARTDDDGEEDALEHTDVRLEVGAGQGGAEREHVDDDEVDDEHGNGGHDPVPTCQEPLKFKSTGGQLDFVCPPTRMVLVHPHGGASYVWAS